MQIPKISLIKSPSTGTVEVVIEDSFYMLPGQVFFLPEGISLEDPLGTYKKRIATLEHELNKAKRAKKHILNNISKGA